MWPGEWPASKGVSRNSLEEEHANETADDAVRAEDTPEHAQGLQITRNPEPRDECGRTRRNVPGWSGLLGRGGGVNRRCAAPGTKPDIRTDDRIACLTDHGTPPGWSFGSKLSHIKL